MAYSAFGLKLILYGQHLVFKNGLAPRRRRNPVRRFTVRFDFKPTFINRPRATEFFIEPTASVSGRVKGKDLSFDVGPAGDKIEIADFTSPSPIMVSSKELLQFIVFGIEPAGLPYLDRCVLAMFPGLIGEPRCSLSMKDDMLNLELSLNRKAVSGKKVAPIFLDFSVVLSREWASTFFQLD